jgi:hypothetical protein
MEDTQIYNNNNELNYQYQNNYGEMRMPIKIIDTTNQPKKLNVNYNKYSNKKIIKSAISTICLAGETNRTFRNKILEIIDKCPCENYIILFKGDYGRYVRIKYLFLFFY